nr:extensin-like [Penaeus vannamei]
MLAHVTRMYAILKSHARGVRREVMRCEARLEVWLKCPKVLNVNACYTSPLTSPVTPIIPAPHINRTSPLNHQFANHTSLTPIHQFHTNNSPITPACHTTNPSHQLHSLTIHQSTNNTSLSHYQPPQSHQPLKPPMPSHHQPPNHTSLSHHNPTIPSHHQSPNHTTNLPLTPPVSYMKTKYGLQDRKLKCLVMFDDSLMKQIGAPAEILSVDTGNSGWMCDIYIDRHATYSRPPIQSTNSLHLPPTYLHLSPTPSTYSLSPSTPTFANPPPQPPTFNRCRHSHPTLTSSLQTSTHLVPLPSPSCSPTTPLSLTSRPHRTHPQNHQYTSSPTPHLHSSILVLPIQPTTPCNHIHSNHNSTPSCHLPPTLPTLPLASSHSLNPYLHPPNVSPPIIYTPKS